MTLRTRNAVLEAMELLRDRHPTLTLAQIIAFLHVADEDEDEATPLADLQHRADLSPVQAWRTATAAGLGGSSAGLGFSGPPPKMLGNEGSIEQPPRDATKTIAASARLERARARWEAWVMAWVLRGLAPRRWPAAWGPRPWR